MSSAWMRRRDEGDPRGRIITLFCTDGGAHEAMRVGFLFPGAGRSPISVLSHSRQSGRQMIEKADGHPLQPEQCSICRRSPRLSPERWLEKAVEVQANGESALDVSTMS